MDETEEIEIKIEYNDIYEDDPLLDRSNINEFDNYSDHEASVLDSKQDERPVCEKFQTSKLNPELEREAIITMKLLTDTEVKTCENNNEERINTKASEEAPMYYSQQQQHLWPRQQGEKKAWSLTNPVSVETEQSSVVKWYREKDSDGKLFCKYCDLSYSVVQTLRYHVRTKHPKEAAILKEVIAKSNRSQKLMCHICDTKCSSMEQLKNHVTAKHNLNDKGRFLCDYCLTIFYSKNELEYHITDKHTAANGEANIDIGKKELQFECNGIRKFPCPYCAHIAKRKYGLKTHIKAKHKSENDLTYVCPFCPYRASIKYYLQNHVTTKHPDSDYARSKTCHFCDVCGYRTPRKSHFVEHRKSHFPVDKRHKCEFCDYATNLSANLEVHRRTHTKEKPYVCGVNGCEYRCSAKTALNSHKLKHDPEKHAVYCDQCNYKTVYKHALKKHRESHDRKTSYISNERKYILEQKTCHLSENNATIIMGVN